MAKLPKTDNPTQYARSKTRNSTQYTRSKTRNSTQYACSKTNNASRYTNTAPLDFSWFNSCPTRPPKQNSTVSIKPTFTNL